MTRHWTNKFSHQLCMVALSPVKALWGKMLSYANQSLHFQRCAHGFIEYAQRLGLCYKLNEQIFASIMHGCPDLSKGTLGQNAQLWKPELALLLRCDPGFIKYCLLKEGIPSQISVVGNRMLRIWMNGCLEHSKGALGQNAQLRQLLRCHALAPRFLWSIFKMREGLPSPDEI